MEEGEKEAGLLQDTADRLHASSQEVQGLKDQLNELEVKQNNDLNAEKEMIKQQFETMAKNFETQKEELEGRLEEKQNEYSETVKIMEENRNISEKSTSEKDEMLKNINDKLKASEKSIYDLEESSKHLVSELSKAKEEIEKGLADCQEAKKNLKSSEKSRSMVEQELKDAKANMVTTEKHASVKALMTSTLDELEQLKLSKKKSDTAQKKVSELETSVARLKKQVAELKDVASKQEAEAEEAAKSPWEGEDWEGLTSTEVWDMMRSDLVPAQQARLLKMCVTELEAALSTSKTDFLKAVAEVSNIMEEKTKLEAKICIIETKSLDKKEKEKMPAKKVVSISKDEKAYEKKEAVEAPKPVVAAAKFTAPAPVKPAPKENLRRSSRSASAVASVLLETMEEMKEKKPVRASPKPVRASPKPVKERGKRPVTPEKPTVEKKQKLKLASSPVKTVRAPATREALAPLTNSPLKAAPPNKASGSEASAQSIRSLRNKEGKKRNAEECKQQ